VFCLPYAIETHWWDCPCTASTKNTHVRPPTARIPFLDDMAARPSSAGPPKPSFSLPIALGCILLSFLWNTHHDSLPASVRRTFGWPHEDSQVFQNPGYVTPSHSCLRMEYSVLHTCLQKLHIQIGYSVRTHAIPPWSLEGGIPDRRRVSLFGTI